MCEGCRYPGRLTGSIVRLLWPRTCMAAELGPLVEDPSRLMLWHADSEAKHRVSGYQLKQQAAGNLLLDPAKQTSVAEKPLDLSNLSCLWFNTCI